MDPRLSEPPTLHPVSSLNTNSWGWYPTPFAARFHMLGHPESAWLCVLCTAEMTTSREVSLIFLGPVIPLYRCT